MNCFYHTDATAVAICKNCQKALCRDCASDVTDGIACKGRCEDKVRSLNELIIRGKTSYQKTGSAYNSAAIIYGLLGLLFTGMSLLSIVLTEDMALLWLLPGGIIFLVGAILNIWNAVKIKRVE